MKKATTIIYILATLINIAKAQLISRTLEFSVLIESSLGSGSGFFLEDSTKLYLVTAKHVLFNEMNKGVLSFDTLINVKYYEQKSEETEPNSLFINLNQALKQKKIKVSEVGDIVVVEMGSIKKGDGIYSVFEYNKGYIDVKHKSKHQAINSFTKTFILYFNQTVIGSDVFLIGFPKSLGLNDTLVFDSNKPLLRKGALAAKYSKNRTYIIDCPAYFGNSGGPVLIVDPIHPSSTHLIGIVTAFIPFVDAWTSEKYKIQRLDIFNSGYGVVESIDKILEVIKSSKTL